MKDKVNTAIDKAVEEVFKDLSVIAEQVIREAVDKTASFIKNDAFMHYARCYFTQWKEKAESKFTNPLILFTNELKRGKYDQLKDEIIDSLHQTAVDLSVYWGSTSELSGDELKSFIGNLLIQEIITRVYAAIERVGYDAQSLFEVILLEGGDA